MRSYRRLAISTLVAVYVLILIGGIVRSTGSGMGCPDWPKCFGSWVPPTDVSQLPADYKEKYSNYRAKKNEKFAKYLRTIGMRETATQLLADKSVLEEADFNATKTWVEYVNRLVGVVIGLLIIALFVRSIRHYKAHRTITIVSFLTLVLVVFQGWIGSFVVSTNLTAWTVTVHMFLAMVLVAFLVFLVDRSNEVRENYKSEVGYWWLVATIAVLSVQILLGTEVREGLDRVASLAERSEWISMLGTSFIIHRSFSWVVLIMHVGLIINLRKTEGAKAFSLTLILLILASILTGVGMAWFAVPAFLQPVHLLLATLCFGMQFMLLLKLNRKETKVSLT